MTAILRHLDRCGVQLNARCALHGKSDDPTLRNHQTAACAAKNYLPAGVMATERAQLARDPERTAQLLYDCLYELLRRYGKKNITETMMRGTSLSMVGLDLHFGAANKFGVRAQFKSPPFPLPNGNGYCAAAQPRSLLLQEAQ